MKRMPLTAVDVLPEYVTVPFKFPFTHFNKVQSTCLESILGNDDSMVVSAPTGSGKTVLMVLAMLRLFFSKQNPLTRKKLKAVYIAPIKALASEKAKEWIAAFAPHGIRVQSVTGDTEGEHDTHIHTILNSDVIVTTPEKFDSVTRRWREAVITTCVQDIGLVLIDEVHLLSEQRGTVLEALVSRMKTIRSAHQRTNTVSHLRFVAISATMTNAKDIGAWLSAPPRNVISFAAADRPVPLTLHVLPYDSHSSPFLFEKYLTYKIPNILLEYGKGRPALVFCQTRRSTAQTAAYIADHLTISSTIEHVPEITNKQLLECLRKGTAFHHAGLSPAERSFVEAMFLERKILVLCTTSTLALGVNLPARLVIIKGTSHFINGKSEELSDGMVMQMAGRAGRAGLDDEGVACIMTSRDQVVRLNNVATTTTVVESRLDEYNIEHVNAEVVLRTINNVDIVLEWFRTTFYWIRVHSNPAFYGLGAISHAELDKKLTEQAGQIITNLVSVSCVTKDPNGDLNATLIGRSMARNYLSYSSVYVIDKHAAQHMSVAAALEVICRCGEFRELRVRQGEKRLLNAYNKSLRFPLLQNGKPKNVSDYWHKVYILIQCWMQEVQIDDWGIKNDQGRVVHLFPRLLRHFIECGGFKEYGLMIVRGYELLRYVKHRMWDTGPLLRQMEGVGNMMVSSLSNIGVTTFEDVKASDVGRLEQVTGRAPPFGLTMKNQAMSLPTYNVTYKKGGVTLHRTSVGDSPVSCIVVAATDTDKLVCYRKVPHQLTYTAEFPTPPAAHTLKVYVINEAWIGIDVQRSFQLRAFPTEEVAKGCDETPSMPSTTPPETTPGNAKATASPRKGVTRKPKPQPKPKVKKDPLELQDVHLKMLHSLSKSGGRPPTQPQAAKYQLPIASEYAEEEKVRSRNTSPVAKSRSPSVSASPASSLSFGFADRTQPLLCDDSHIVTQLDFEAMSPDSEDILNPQPLDLLQGLDIDLDVSPPSPPKQVQPSSTVAALHPSKRRKFCLGLPDGNALGMKNTCTDLALPPAEPSEPILHPSVIKDGPQPLLFKPPPQRVAPTPLVPTPTPAPAPTSSVSQGAELVSQLSKLSELVVGGMLSREEFQSAKRLLLKMDQRDEQENVLHPSLDTQEQAGVLQAVQVAPCDKQEDRFDLRVKPFKAPGDELSCSKFLNQQPAPAVHWGRRPTTQTTHSSSPSPQIPKALPSPRAQQKQQPQQSYVSDFLAKF